VLVGANHRSALQAALGLSSTRHQAVSLRRMQGREGKTAASDIGKLRPSLVMSALSWAATTGCHFLHPLQRSKTINSQTQHSSSTKGACSPVMGQPTSTPKAMQSTQVNITCTTSVSELHEHDSSLGAGAGQSHRPTGKTMCSVVMLKVGGQVGGLN
jgi:hypothetical protein